MNPLWICAARRRPMPPTTIVPEPSRQILVGNSNVASLKLILGLDANPLPDHRPRLPTYLVADEHALCAYPFVALLVCF